MELLLLSVCIAERLAEGSGRCLLYKKEVKKIKLNKNTTD
jgi:hypothetical protein